MRTDSERLSDDFVVELKKKIVSDYGKEYYSGSINFSKKSETANVQDAHEGIRPTHLELTPEKVAHVLSNEELRVYTLIYNRTVASMMVDADVKDTEVMIYNGKHRYGITGHELVFDGFMKVYSEFSDEQSDDSSVILPSFKVGEKIADKPLIVEKKQTNPPARYTEAKLIKELEKLGIGRPSTYASIMDTLTNRDYTTQENKSLIPTQKGIEVINMLVQYFSTIINSTYTAQMEGKLDEISEGKAEKLEELKKFYTEFEPLVLKAFREFENGREKPIMTDKLCPKCGANMVLRTGKYGQFYACSKYPKCKTTEPFADPNKKPAEKAPVQDTGHTCPVCNEGKIVKRVSKSGKNAGSVFYACNAFPKCKTTFNEKDFLAKFNTQEFSELSTDQED
jgi:DNA topoisomerase-1